MKYAHSIRLNVFSYENENSGIILDKYKQREYIWLDDPDGIRQEFYLRYPKEK